MRSLTARLRNHPAHELVSWEPARSVGRFLRTFSRLSGNVGKHSLECFAPGRIGVLRLGFLALSRKIQGREASLRQESSQHHTHLQTQQTLNTLCQS